MSRKIERGQFLGGGGALSERGAPSWTRAHRQVSPYPSAVVQRVLCAALGEGLGGEGVVVGHREEPVWVWGVRNEPWSPAEEVEQEEPVVLLPKSEPTRSRAPSSGPLNRYYRNRAKGAIRGKRSSPARACIDLQTPLNPLLKKILYSPQAKRQRYMASGQAGEPEQLPPQRLMKDYRHLRGVDYPINRSALKLKSVPRDTLNKAATLSCCKLHPDGRDGFI